MSQSVRAASCGVQEEEEDLITKSTHNAFCGDWAAAEGLLYNPGGALSAQRLGLSSERERAATEANRHRRCPLKWPFKEREGRKK